MKLKPLSQAILIALVGNTSWNITAIADEANATSGSERAIDTINVTATRMKRATKETPGSVTVIDSELIESRKMYNIKDAIQGTPGVLIESSSGSSSPRLIIRGAGQKANYGVREIMVIRDGVPMTDPDSFSRFDFIDTQDIEQIEITKGPGSLYGSGSSGGTIQIISKSVFDDQDNQVKFGAGSYGSLMGHFRVSGDINDSNAFAITGSHRESENSWRDWNEFSSDQLSFKHGFMFDSGDTLETELSYSVSDVQLPASMTETEFEAFEETGKQRDTSSEWQNSGRYSKIWFFNSRLEKDLGAVTFKPRVYFNNWEHYHPVTGSINDNTGGGTNVFGGDLEFLYAHNLWGPSDLVAGITGRIDDTDSSRKYKYADVTTETTTPPWPPGAPDEVTLIHTNSDERGDLMRDQESTISLYGVYFQESMRPSDCWNVDASLRYDNASFDIHTVEYSEYDWGSGFWSDHATPQISDTNKEFDLFSSKVGATYSMTDSISVFGLAAQTDQLPSEGEIRENQDLEPSTATNFEIGLKGRSRDWSMDTSIYYMTVKDEIVSVLNGWSTEFVNAGKTEKKGFEFASSYFIDQNWTIGFNYAYSDYTFVDFTEPVRGVGDVDQSGKQIPYVPKNQYSLSLGYNHPSGFKGRIQADTWGEYYTDNSNSVTYGGYELLTSLMLGYAKGPHSITLNVDNLFNQRYATEVKTNTSGESTYRAGEPIAGMLSYSYSF
ncbi:MAG: TonB-dependent receptor [Gammaproteobacteria bacterium]|nr:TonB-dependent receptor [Gammaproteobacteria bacterium]